MLFVPGLQTRLFSIESFTSDGKTSATYINGNVKLGFGSNITIRIGLPHLPPSIFNCEMESVANVQKEDRVNSKTPTTMFGITHPIQ